MFHFFSISPTGNLRLFHKFGTPPGILTIFALPLGFSKLSKIYRVVKDLFLKTLVYNNK